MKKLYIVFMALLTWVGSAFAADELTVANITSDAGSEATLVIDFNFTTDNFTGYQFDLVLPSGIVTVKDEEGAPSFELGEEVYYKSHTVSASHLSSCDRFVCLSTNSSVFKKIQGTLLSIPISVDADVNSGTYDGKLKSIQFGTKDGRTIYLNDVSFIVTVNSPGGETLPLGDRLVVDNITASQGQIKSIDIKFAFETDNFTGYQFDLVLPSGIVTVKDEEGVPSFELGEEVYYKSHTVSASHLSSCDRFVCLSTNSSVFKKMQGTLLSIPICVDADVNSDTYDGKLKNIQFGTKDGKTIYFEDVPFSITIGDATLVGDVNYDGLISIADVTALVNILLGNDDAEPYKYNHKAANVNGDEDINSEDVTALMGIILGE